MSSLPNNFTYEEFKNKHTFLEKLKFSILYNEFYNHTEFYGNARTYCTEIKNGMLFPYEDENLILNFCHNLYKINVKINGWQDLLFNYLSENDKTYCTSLKYWLYEEIGKLSPKGQKIDENFQKLKEMLESKIGSKLSVTCTFNELDWDEHQKLKSIYAFMLIYYSNIDAFKVNNNIECKYLDYFGYGLKEYYDSLNRCSAKEESKYCKEFNEFKEFFKEVDLYWKTSEAEKSYIYSGDDTVNCALAIESTYDSLNLSYWHEKKIIHLSDYPNASSKSTIISASSAIGATAGFTNIGSLFGHVKQKDNTMLLNVDEEIHDFAFPISEPEHTNFVDREYKISYFSVDNS
ncbi:hypothetical protein, conserved [Plasmodium ovale]|uniref:PIR protein n=1 Tax=Plasmodium ovale TaxID=36330 RepID=A0A1C3KKZ0_PLAOA|nr:hypothetical protein, conserved [Plasmodium ovale]